MTTLEKVIFIASRASLRIEKWRDAPHEAWRAGIEWYGENDYEFVCEYATIDECLDGIIEYKKSWRDEPKKP